MKFCQFVNTTLAVYHLSADLLRLFHNKTCCICLFLYLCKVFDTVYVKILVEKLKMCGIRGTASLLINNYLSNRDQYVACDKYKSDILPITIGVPQRSVSSLLLFNIFINDISQLGVINVFFADDAILLCRISKFSWISWNYSRIRSIIVWLTLYQ